METAFLARHGESELSARDAANGDPRVACGLTAAGREQARALGARLADEPLELCVVTEFQRVRETADLALAGRDVPRLVVPELNDIRLGDYEGRALDDYRAWAWNAEPTEAGPGGGESRGEVAARYARGLRIVLARPERRILVVAHSLPLRYALEAAEGRTPPRRAASVDYATAYPFAAPRLQRVAALLEAWSAAPAWRD